MPKDDDVVPPPLRLTDEVQQVFDELIHRPWQIASQIRGWNPLLDLYETEDGYVLEADVPGVKVKDLRIEIDREILILKGLRNAERHYCTGRLYAMERPVGEFVRQIGLPQAVDKDAIKADIDGGVLRVLMPKIKSKK